MLRPEISKLGEYSMATGVVTVWTPNGDAVLSEFQPQRPGVELAAWANRILQADTTLPAAPVEDADDVDS